MMISIMKYKFSAILTAIVLTHSMLHAAEIKFAAKKGEVVAHSEREVVLSVAKKHLEGKGEGAFLAELKSVEE
ncbi:MAG TPA: hypothetical protein DCX06_00135, partial [Opitutae bacterium]|nr:hypothetical protein [Opitutae bacterium]